MSSAIRIVSARRDGIFEGELGPYIPASLVEDLATRPNVDEARPTEAKDLEQSKDEVARSARTLGEVRFGGEESVEEWMNPSPVLGVAEESTDGPMTPPPHLQLRRNQLDLSLESTDGKMTPTRTELMETAELTNSLREASPPFNGVLDMVEEHLRQTTASSEEEHLQSTGSSVKERLRQTTGSSARRQLQPTTDSSEIATAVVPVECTSTRAVVYPNSKSVVQPIIIENNKRQFPVTSEDTTGELGENERDLHSTTAATGVAGAELKTGTGHRYNQIPSSHVEPTERRDLSGRM